MDAFQSYEALNNIVPPRERVAAPYGVFRVARTYKELQLKYIKDKHYFINTKKKGGDDDKDMDGEGGVIVYV
jgi:hypothetical protein